MTVLADLRKYLNTTALGGSHPNMVVMPRAKTEALLDIAEAAQAFMEAWDEELDDEFRTEEEKFDALRASLARLESPDG